jgi:hypothetical protein
MVLGYQNEQDLIRKWEQTYNTRIFTSGTSNIDAIRALDVKRFVGATYFRGDINRIYGQYFIDAGFDCLDMVGIDVDFDKVPNLPKRSGLSLYQRCVPQAQQGAGDLHARTGLAHARYHREIGSGTRRAGHSCRSGAVLGHPVPPRYPRAGQRFWAPHRRNARWRDHFHAAGS